MNTQSNLQQKNRNEDRLIEKLPTPRKSAEDKAESLLNVLRGYEELITDVNGIILSSNLEIVCITGYEEWEVIGKHISIFYTPEEIESGKQEADLKNAELLGTIREEGWKVKKRNGKFWAKVKIFAIRDSLKNLTGFRVIMRDETHKAFHDYKLTQRKKAQVEFYNYSTIGLVEFMLGAGRITIINTYAQHLLGISGDAVFFSEIFAESEKYDQLMELIDKNRHTNNFEFQLKNGRWISLDCKFFLRRGVVEGLLTEITDRKKKEEEVMNLNDDLQMFLYHASHDLRSPLTTIFGLINLIEIDGAPNEKKYTAMIKNRVDHLDSLLRELTAITFNNSKPVTFQQFNPGYELQYVLDGMDTKSLLNITLDVDPHLYLYSDLPRFRVILKNLLSNAIKFKDDSKSIPYVKIRISMEKGNELTIRVSDNGIGMSEDQIAKLFRPFYRGHSSLSGHGLGLYIVHSMVKALKGSITVNSIPTVGTTIDVRIKEDHAQSAKIQDRDKVSD